MGKHVIYGLTHPITNELKYIGYSSNVKKRFMQHMSPSLLKKKTRKVSWIKSLINEGLNPKLIILEEYEYYKELQQAEIEAIEYYKYIGCQLTNGDLGGVGGKGRIHTEEQNRRKSEMQKGRKITWGDKISKSKLGHSVSEETKKKISQANIGKPGWNTGQKLSEEGKKVLSDSHLITNKLLNNCLFCNGNTNIVLDLGSTPLANNFTEKSEIQEIFPLKLSQCENCNHVQLNYSVNKNILFKKYFYVSGTSSVNIDHFKKYADKIIEKFSLSNKDAILDIASNDGCFLSNFQKKGIKIIGIDPAENIVKQANKDGIFTICDFFNEKSSAKIKKLYGKMNVITCNNMLAHNMGIKGTIKGVKLLLDKEGSFIFENSYLLDIVNHNLIDLVYHEHLHHFHITPLIKLFSKLEMDIYDVERLPNHGGSIRVYTCFKGKKEINQSVMECVELEKSINNKLTKMQDSLIILKKELNKKLYDVVRDDKKIAIYGFPAKATTLMYGLDIDHTLIDFIVDDAELKQGRYIPTQDIKRIFKIENPNVIKEKNPDAILILAWNFADSIMSRCRKDGFRGKFIIPLPELRIIE